MAAKEGKRKEKVRLLVEVVEEVGRVHASVGAAAARLHGPEGAAGGRRAILRQLRDEGPLTVPEIARSRNVSRQYVQTVVNELLAAGHLQTKPNPEHKRSPRLSVAKSGIAFLDEAAQREEPFAEALASDFKRSELNEALGLLQRLRSALDGHAPDESQS